jgi:hypothetical protein
MWKIIFEDQANQRTLEAVYDEEPVDDLKAIEVLYYAQQE